MAKQKREPKIEKKHFSIKVIIMIVAVIAIGIIVFTLFLHPFINIADESNNTPVTDYGVPTMENINQGKMLAQSHCATCHMLPEPALLDRARWKNVFPQMGLRLGIKEHQGEVYTDAVKAPDIYIPTKPVLTHEQWRDIIDYYMNTAPIQLPVQNRTVEIERKMPFFSLLPAPKSFNGGKVLGCMVRIDSTVKPARIFVANGLKKELYLLTNKFKVMDSVKTAGPVTDILFDQGKTMICIIGRELGATSDKFGTINELTISGAGKMYISTKPVFSGLARPVSVLAADLNNDQLTDYILCEFGNINGELCWMENKGNGSFIKHILRGMPGTISACVDFDRDKNAPDLWVLFAQGEEGIYHFINNGKGGFTQKRVLRFPPAYGSSSFEMVDINHDGFKDIIYTCGDNGDATLVMKPYHGVYVFINDRHGNYLQKYFYPINGCYKAIARDFDGDGNIDIATVSLFTDARQPEEGFVYLKNLGGLNFKPYALPAGTRFERAVTMAEGDINGDGKPDLLIGNAFFNIGPFKKNVSEPLFFVLKN